MNSGLAGGLRDTVHLLAVLGHAVLRHSALRGRWDLPALKIKEECACLTSPGPMWEPWMLCGSVSLSKEVISGILWSRKGQPAARVKTSALNFDTYCLIYSSFTFQKLFIKHQGYARFMLFSLFSN